MEQISLFKVFMSEDVKDPIIKTLMSGFVTQGPRVEEFEQKLQEYFNHPYILTLNSATAGLTLGLRVLIDKEHFDLNKDIVLSTPLTCFATNAAIMANNAKIQWVDTDLETGNMCLEDLKNKLNENTKVIYFVHWGGSPIDLDKLEEIKDYCFEKYGFRPYVVEDCAHAFGAEYKGKKLGTHGNIGVFSLQAIKHLTTGDGGLIFLPNKELYEHCKLLRWYGIDRDKRNYKRKDFRLEHDIANYGYKFHMNDINATIGLANLPHIDSLLVKSRKNGEYYNEALKNVKGVTLMKEYGKSAYWLYTFRIERKMEFIQYMKEKNVMVSQVHARNDLNSCLDKSRIELPKLDIIEKDLVCIPVGWWVTKENREYIVKCIKEFNNN